MPKKQLRKSIRTYFSKRLKKIQTLSHLPTPSTTSLLSSCKYPRTPSFANPRAHHHVSNNNATTAATLSDVDHFIFENFNSLYLHDDEVGPASASASATADDVVKPSERFFVSSGMSGSASSSSDQESSKVLLGGVAVMTLSNEPYDDFLRSMKEMVKEKIVVEVDVDWDFMVELLFCYLELNDRSVHKHILRAFTDLTVSFQ